MGVFKVLMMILVSMSVYQLYSKLSYVPMPSLEPDPWWAGGPRGKEDISIRKFHINVSDKDLKDLNDRLNLPTRLIPPLDGTNFTYGFNSNTLKKIVHHWKSNYNWREREQKMNQLNHYKTNIEGLDIHFVRVKANVTSDVTVRPLLLIHGWPGSFVEFMDILPMLTQPQKGGNIAFEVIAPSLPGYAFSDRSTKPGLGVAQTAQMFNKLMKRLGFDKYYVQGGDWGSMIASTMGTLYHDNVLGIHLSFEAYQTPLSIFKYLLGSILPSGFVMEKSNEPYLYPIGEYLHQALKETGYMHLQATKPDTIGIALSSSPEGLAAYILEKFSTWTNKEGPNKPDGGLLTNFPICLDKLLDNINIYWFTQSITTSMRFYAELGQFLEMKMGQIPITTPTGIALFPGEIFLAPKSFVTEKYRNLISYKVFSSGGHFAAMEVPQVLADDIFNFVVNAKR